MQSKSALVITLFVILFVLAIIFGPLITIWVINTLFGTSTPYTLVTWFAALLGHMSISGLARRKD